MVHLAPGSHYFHLSPDRPRPEGGVGAAAERGNHFNQWCVPMCAARVDIVCNPRYSGEYIINYISLLIISILPSIWSYILKECQVLVEVEEKEAEAQS